MEILPWGIQWLTGHISLKVEWSEPVPGMECFTVPARLGSGYITPDVETPNVPTPNILKQIKS